MRILSGMYKGITIKVPSLDIQSRLVSRIVSFQNTSNLLQANFQQELDALDELKKSILQKAFNGEL